MEELYPGVKRLHFFRNEKVVDDAISLFEEVFPEENLYVVLSEDGQAPLVKSCNKTICSNYRSPELKRIIKNCYAFKEIICHSLWKELDIIVSKINHPNITWVIWGADLFEEVLYKNGYKLYFDEKELLKIRSRSLPVPLYRFLVGIRDTINYHHRINAIQRINSICATAPRDIDLLTKYVSLKKEYNRKQIFYYPIDKILDKSTRNSFVSGSDIWVNNAAGYNGNHIEIFKRIKDFKRKETVHVPLSYGINRYAEYVAIKGKEILGESFDPMMSFLPKEEYYKRFLGSNSFIFGHLRGCATGNVIVALYLGAKVFLFKENVLYDFLKKEGVVLFDIDEELNENNVYAPLPLITRNNNRTIVLRMFSTTRLLNTIKDNFSL